MQPSAFPWLSPKVVTLNNSPNVLPDMALIIAQNIVNSIFKRSKARVYKI